MAEQITKTFGNENYLVTAVDDINFKIAEGEFIAVRGKSGE